MSILDRRLTRTLTIDRMKIRHVGDVMGIERDAYPRPWTAQVFHDELHEARVRPTATTWSPGAAARSSATAG